MSEFKTTVPNGWRGRCSGDGYERYTDNEGNRRYTDNYEKVSDMPYRPCSKCGEYPTEEGDDYCLQHLGNVMNACCGHGNQKGYVQFDCGIVIRGFFEIEKFDIEGGIK